MIHHTCPYCYCPLANNFYGYEDESDHVCVTKSDSDAMFAGFESLLSKWYPFSDYMARRGERL